ITTFQDYTVTETTPSGWGFDSVACSRLSGTENGGSYTTSNATVAITMKEGEEWTCTYNNSLPKLTVTKKLVSTPGDTSTFNLTIDGATAGTGANVGDGGTTGAVFVTTGDHTVGETAGTGGTLLTDYTTTF